MEKKSKKKVKIKDNWTKEVMNDIMSSNIKEVDQENCSCCH